MWSRTSGPKQIMELVPKVFSPVEQAQLAALADAEKLDRALSLWTLKESYIKARGLGLLVPLDEFSFVFGGAEGIRLEIDPRLAMRLGAGVFASSITLGIGLR